MSNRCMRPAALAALFLLVACGGGGSGAPAPAGGGAPPVITGLACEADLVPALEFFEATSELPWAGAIEFGQTHVVREAETRRAPRPLAERDTLLLFTPDVPVPPDADVRIAAYDAGAPLGVLALRPPDELPTPLEADLTTAPLDPYSTEAWSVFLPWRWVREGVRLRVARLVGDVLHVRELVLEDLGAPSRFTITRAKILLFGDASFDTTTQPASRVARDFYASLPVAELRWVDTLPWVLDACVVRTATGPQLVTSEADRRAVASDTDHWSILKHQMALRLSLANTGRGLVLTGEAAGDSSPYAFGTSVAMGWFVDPDGYYRDIDDAPYAAGWTGWTAMWLGECGNAFIHEVGHSCTLLHFTTGTAASWGIADEYPQDGTNLVSHPWGWDSTRRRLRTWYRVDANGPVMDAGGLVGKRDPMNGGEAGNTVTCFPQYTAYHAQKIQGWAESTPTVANPYGTPGVFRWNDFAHGYEPYPLDPAYQAPLDVDVPVATFVGTLGATDPACQTYPPVYMASGNVFALPDPLVAGLPAAYDGARYFVEITYADATVERALVASDVLTDTSLRLFSFNVAADRGPVRVDLCRSPTPYPAIDIGLATVVHQRFVAPPAGPLPRVVTVGRGRIANDGVTLQEPCEDGINCERRRRESTWRVADAPLSFEDAAGQTPAATTCADRGGYTVLSVPVVDAGGMPANVIVHAQRVVVSGASTFAVPLEDETPWIDSPDLEQALRAWLPYARNTGLPAGRYRTVEPFDVRDLLGGLPYDESPLEIDLEVLPRTPVDLGAGEYLTDPLSTPNSSMNFLVRDPAIGPTSRVWWDDGIPGPVILHVPVLDAGTGEMTVLLLDALQESCGARWDLHAGRVADGCTHQAVLNVSATGNEHLVSGHVYRTPDSAPLVIEGRRWHDPDGQALIGVFALDLRYTAP